MINMQRPYLVMTSGWLIAEYVGGSLNDVLESESADGEAQEEE